MGEEERERKGDSIMSTMKASEFMIPLDAYPHVPYWFSIRQAVAIMEKAEGGPDGHSRFTGAHCVLVFNESYKLLGIVRCSDILRGLQPVSCAGEQAPAPIAGDRRLQETSSSDGLRRELGIQAERPISEVMNPIQSTVDHEEHLLQVMSRMLEQNTSMLPVLRDGMVIGVVRSVEVFHEIASLIL
jgi:CBS-domain-containing membrane protein